MSEMEKTLMKLARLTILRPLKSHCKFSQGFEGFKKSRRFVSTSVVIQVLLLVRKALDEDINQA